MKDKHLDLLGSYVEDRITRATGVVTSICFDLYGCIQATVHLGMNPDGSFREQAWFDVSRLRVLSDERAMQVPNFEWTPETIASGGKGPAEKPVLHKF